MVSRKTRFLADENVDARLAQRLRDHRCPVLTAAEAGLEGQSDHRHWEFARRTDRVLLTHDVGFLDERAFPATEGSGVVYLAQDIESGVWETRLCVIVGLARLGGFLRRRKVAFDREGTATIFHDGSETRHSFQGTKRQIWQEIRRRFLPPSSP